MTITREQFVASLRKYRGVKFSHQGRNRITGMDCGGHFLVSARDEGLTGLEFLGYASFPTSGKFDELLNEHAVFLWERKFPFNFDGTELLPADFISFDYGNGEGTRHMAAVTEWDGRRYRVIDANPNYGVCEHALAPPFVTSKTTLKGWRAPQFA
jgi:hypothetical protein